MGYNLAAIDLQIVIKGALDPAAIYAVKRKGMKDVLELAKTACRTQERWFLGDDCQLDASALADPAQQAQEGAARLSLLMPPQQAHGDIGLLQPQQSGMGSKDDVEFLKRLAIPDDACSVDGPPTPDNEEGHRVSMPAIHGSNEATSPGIVAAAARVLHLL